MAPRRERYPPLPDERLDSVRGVPDSPPQAVGGTLIGYARCSTAAQDLTAQQDALRALGVKKERIYLDRGLTGRNRERPGLGKALAAVRDGDTLVVPKLDRLARSVPDARAIAEDSWTAVQTGPWEAFGVSADRVPS